MSTTQNILLEPKPRLGRRVVLFPVPLQGHINPMLQLASILDSQGFSITIIYLTLNSLNVSNYPHFEFIQVPAVEGRQPDPNAGAIADTMLMNKHGSGIFREFLADLVAKEKVACLISDALFYFTHEVARDVELPNLVLRTGSLNSFLLFEATESIGQKGYYTITEQDSRWEEPVPDFPVVKGKDIPKIIGLHTEAFLEIIYNMTKQTKLASGIIWNSFKELEESAFPTILEHFPCPSFTIGPFHKYFPASSSSLLAQDRSCLSWLDTQAPNSVLYVSFGSVAHIDEAMFLEVAIALANSKQPFLWVVRPGLIHGHEWLEPLPNGYLEEISGFGKIIKWSPQQEVLAHPATGGFLTHSGWNSTLESICEGVPVICSPSFGDQPVNARCISDLWKVGLTLENGIVSADIEAAIKRLMVDKEGEEMRERITRLKESVDHCLQEGGSSYQSLQSLVDHILSF